MRQYKSIFQYRIFGTRVINYRGKNFEQCTEIKFCCKAGFTAVKTWEMFVKALGNSSVLCAMIFRWCSWFAVAEESVENT